MKLDTSIPATLKSGSITCAIDGSVFTYSEADPQSKIEATKKFNDHGRKLIDTLEAKAGRRLTARELVGFRGIEHADDRSREARKADVQVTSHQQSEENVFDRMLRNGPPNKRRYETREEMLRRKSREYEAAQASKRAAEEKQAAMMTPARKRAIAKAEGTLRELRFDPTATRTEIDSAEARLALARTGELSDFAAAQKDWIASRDEKTEAEMRMIQAQIDLLREQQQQLKNHAFELPEVEEVPSV